MMIPPNTEIRSCTCNELTVEVGVFGMGTLSFLFLTRYIMTDAICDQNWRKTRGVDSG